MKNQTPWANAKPGQLWNVPHPELETLERALYNDQNEFSFQDGDVFTRHEINFDPKLTTQAHLLLDTESKTK